MLDLEWRKRRHETNHKLALHDRVLEKTVAGPNNCIVLPPMRSRMETRLAGPTPREET